MRSLLFSCVLLIVPFAMAKESSFVTVHGREFRLNGKEYKVAGANYWQGINLGAPDSAGGNRTRLVLELDQLKEMGVNNLRIMASSEGPDDQPYRMRPSLQPSPEK
ncbi:hypothetical protein G6F56_008472 [Rhizopus delemar]|nr:hypothetical protein G6F56_008472 [Rhizopus delemar]